jgi:hypothetical protein
MAAAIKNVTVIGGGLMGSGIAQVKKFCIFDGFGSRLISCVFDFLLKIRKKCLLLPNIYSYLPREETLV